MKLIHGDCLKEMFNIPDNSVDLLLADPPYGKSGAVIYENIYNHSRRILKDGGYLIIYLSDYWLDIVLPPAFNYLDYFYLFHHINKKTSSIFPRKIFAGGKSILALSKGKPKKINNWVNNVISNHKISKKNRDDKWEQPVEDAEFFISNYTDENDIVLDPFMGSGTTGVACKNLNRNFVGIEIDAKYFKIAKQRIEGRN